MTRSALTDEETAALAEVCPKCAAMDGIWCFTDTTHKLAAQYLHHGRTTVAQQHAVAVRRAAHAARLAAQGSPEGLMP